MPYGHASMLLLGEGSEATEPYNKYESIFFGLVQPKFIFELVQPKFIFGLVEPKFIFGLVNSRRINRKDPNLVVIIFVIIVFNSTSLFVTECGGSQIAIGGRGCLADRG